MTESMQPGKVLSPLADFTIPLRLGVPIVFDETHLHQPASVAWRDPIMRTQETIEECRNIVDEWVKNILHHTTSGRNPMNEQSYPTFQRAGIELGDECTVTLRDGTVVSGRLREYETDTFNSERNTVRIGSALLDRNISGARWTLVKKKELPGQRHVAGLRSGQRVKIWLKPANDVARPTKVDGVFVRVERLSTMGVLMVHLAGELAFRANLIERLEVVA